MRSDVRATCIMLPVDFLKADGLLGRGCMWGENYITRVLHANTQGSPHSIHGHANTQGSPHSPLTWDMLIHRVLPIVH